MGECVLTSATFGITTPKKATQQAMPRWKRPASEWGQGSISRLISRPWSEVVQSDLTGQLVHTLGFADSASPDV